MNGAGCAVAIPGPRCEPPREVKRLAGPEQAKQGHGNAGQGTAQNQNRNWIEFPNNAPHRTAVPRHDF